jgi:hypothetical protein
MPRPKSDIKKVNLYLGAAHMEALTRIAVGLNLINRAGSTCGQPDRTKAVRAAIEYMDREVARKVARRVARKTSENSPTEG